MLHQLAVPDSAADTRLDVWLETQLDGCTRSLVSRLIKEGSCTVALGSLTIKSKAGYFLKGGELVAIDVPELEPMDAEPEDIPLTVLHEDEHVVVINKPADMVVHPAIGHRRGTLVNALLGRYGQALGGEPWRPGIIHRLDEDTSGVIAVARTNASLAFFQEAFRERTVGKRYLALIHGEPRADWMEHAGWIGRHPKDIRKRAVFAAETDGAKEAYTSVMVRQRGVGYAVAEARPRTGRTHQVRVHLAALGHPVLADRIYSRSDRWPLGARDDDPKALHRQGLHAWALDLPHPNGSRLRIVAPPPADIAQWLVQPLEPTPFEAAN